ncbi:MAG: hypothetical protein J6T41_02640, partial [Neisseriaceae bacterium]|nr:hypothetical protein [Neisseriaceae bacterium]
QQAQVITNAMGGKGYKIVQMDLNGGNAMVFRSAVRSAPMMAKGAEAAQMDIESGDSEVRVDISGSIQVQ